uniref:baseplate tail-tube junction protein n=1 Tax=Aeromonas rivipollensis TaxID=948519 RepID=UPI003D23B752
MGAYNAEMGGNKVLGNRQAELFKGTALRTQTYLFPLRPRNLAELKEVGRIIATFQSLSVGEYQGEIVNILLKIKNSFLPTKQILIGL